MNCSPRTAQIKSQARSPNVFTPKIGTTKELIDKTSMQAVFRYNSLFKRQVTHKKAPSSPKTQKTAKQLTINPNVGGRIPSTTPKHSKSIDRTKTPVAGNKPTVFTKQPLSCKNKQMQGDPFFVSTRLRKPETPTPKGHPASPQLGINKKVQNYVSTKNKENGEKENVNRLEFFKSALAEKQARAKKTLEVVEAIDTDELRALDVDAVIAQYTKLLALYCYLGNQDDCYVVIKQYTEAVQQDSFLAFERLFNDSPMARELLLAIKYELLTVLALFYFLIERGNADQFNDVLEILATNGYCLLSLLRSALEFTMQNKAAKKIDEFLKASQTSTLFSKHKNYALTIKKNNAVLRTELDRLIKAVPSSACKSTLGKLPLLSLSEAIHLSFESFYGLLSRKGVISVVDQELPADGSGVTGEDDMPNFIIQPLEASYALPAKASQHEYTLVLDLDETLVHYDEVGGQFFLRPFAQEFLVQTAELFEVVIFTAAVKEYADWILDRLDTSKCISHRLYRCSTSQQNGVYIKDLQKLGRELSKALIVDNSPENFQLQPENGIYIKTWYDDASDTALEELLKVLRFVAEQRGKDVRESLKALREKSLKK